MARSQKFPSVKSFASTITSYRWPIPIDTSVVLYGTMGTKSVEITSSVWLSIIKRKCWSAAALTSRSRYRFPASKLVSNRDPDSLYVLVPLMRPLTAVGGPPVAAWRTRLSAVSLCDLSIPKDQTDSRRRRRAYMVPIVQEQVAEILVVISRCWAVDHNATEDTIPGLNVEMAVVPATSVLGRSPLICERVTYQRK